jgi:hypothetical protein
MSRVSALLALVVWVGGAVTTPSDVSLELRGERPGKPPLVRRMFRLTAANPTQAERWVIVDRKVPADGGGVDKLEALSTGRVTFGRFLGSGGFYAFLLAPGARLTVDNLEVQWWDASAADPAAVRVRTAQRLTLGGSDAASWFKERPLIAGTVSVDAEKAAHSHSTSSPDGAEVALRVEN